MAASVGMQPQASLMFTTAHAIGGIVVNGLFANVRVSANIAELLAEGDTIAMKGFRRQGYADGNALVARLEHLGAETTRVYLVRNAEDAS